MASAREPVVSEPPAVSVVMATVADAATLDAAIDSILTQSFRDLELIVIDDGSTDETPRILARAGARDARLRLLRNERQIGLARSLNRGLERARGRFIARMDSDDRSHPDRLARQIAFLARHPEIGLLGTQPRLVDDAGRPVTGWGWTVPVDHDAIAWQLLTGSPFVHPSVVIRADLLRAAGGYDPAFLGNEDMELWSRLVRSTRCANLDERLIDYRVPMQTVAGWQAAMEPRIEQVSRRYMEGLLGRNVSADLTRVIVGLDRRGAAPDAAPDRLLEASLLLAELFDAMRDRGIIDGGEAGPARERMRRQVQCLVAAARERA